MKKFISSGAVAGVIWGMASMALNSMTGIFRPEGGILHDLASFTAAGALVGAVTGGLLRASGGVLPFKNIFARAVFVSLALWLLLKAGGSVLSKMEPQRYHIVTPEAVQGLCLSIILGVVIGFLLKKEDKWSGAD